MAVKKNYGGKGTTKISNSNFLGQIFFLGAIPIVLLCARVLFVPRRRSVHRAQDADVLLSAGCATACLRL
jgi:hypothetical protein